MTPGERVIMSGTSIIAQISMSLIIQIYYFDYFQGRQYSTGRSSQTYVPGMYIRLYNIEQPESIYELRHVISNNVTF